MNLDARELALVGAATVMFLVGIGLVLFYGPTLTMVGIVLITLSAVTLLLGVKDVIGDWRNARET